MRLHPLGELVARRTSRERWMLVLSGTWSIVRSPLGLTCLAAIFGAAVVTSLAIDAGPWMLFLFMLSPIGGTTVLILLLIGIGTRQLSQARAARLRDVMLAAGLCPVCAYELSNVTSDHDRCRICPECGAAWNSSEIAVPLPKSGAEKRVVVSDSHSGSQPR